MTEGEQRPDRAVPDSTQDVRFRALAEHLRDAIVEIAPDSVLLWVSPSFAELLGWRPEDVLGKPSRDLIHPEDRDGVDAIRQHVFAEGRPARLTFRHRHGAGGWRWVEAAGRPFRAAEGDLRAVFVIRDVEESVGARGALLAQLEVESRIARLSRRFLEVGREGFEQCVREGLSVAAELAGAQRAQFFMMTATADGVSARMSWCAPGIAPGDPGDLASAVERFPWSSRRLLGGAIVHVARLDELPPDASPERETLARDGALSYLALPIHRDGRAVGVLDFFRMHEERPWTTQEITRLELVADVFASAARRVQAEQSLLTNQRRFEALTRHARDTICEMSLDGRVLWVSPSFEQISGFTPGDVARMQDPWTRIHEEDLAGLEAMGREVAASGRGGGPVRYRYRHRDGSWRWIESNVSLFSTPAGEKRVGIVSRDVTQDEEQRRRLVRQLEVERHVADFSRALLQEGAQEIDVGIERSLEAFGRMAGADRAYLVTRLNGLAPTPTSYDWCAPGTRPRLHPLGMQDREQQRWIAHRLARGEIVQIPRTRELPDEAAPAREALLEAGILSYLAFPIRDDDSLLGVLGFHFLGRERDWSAHEITTLRLVANVFAGALRRKQAEVELRESQERLLQAQKMEAVGTLAGGIAHDFNNQLTVILANSRHAQRAVGSDPDLAFALEDLNRAAEHCAQLTRALLAFSRRTPAAPRSLAVREISENAAELLRPLVPRSIEFRVAEAGGDACVVADPTQIQQVLVNLVVNACDAMPEGGRLDLRSAGRRLGPEEARRLGLPGAGAYVEFAVEDTGSGIPEDVCGRIFEPFFTTKPAGSGTGLGLATAWGIVEEAGGVIAVDSRPGIGSTFRVLLPRDEHDDALEAGSDVPEAPGALRVVVAEDDERVRRLLVRTLRSAGYELIEAADGVDALEKVRASPLPIDALVADLDMPRLGGTALARALRAEHPDLPVVFVSGGRTLVGAEVTGARTQLLTKPFPEEALPETLHRLLSGE